MKLSEIRKVIGNRLRVVGNEDLDIRHLLIDSRELKSEWRPDEVLFFAIKTAKNDGAKYIPEERRSEVYP